MLERDTGKVHLEIVDRFFNVLFSHFQSLSSFGDRADGVLFRIEISLAGGMELYACHSIQQCLLAELNRLQKLTQDSGSRCRSCTWPYSGHRHAVVSF